jgi:Skp family chaperone for outer membrane proteins
MKTWKGLCLGVALVLAAGGAAQAQAPSQDTQAKTAPAQAAPVRPFPDGTTLAYVDMQAVGRESALGKRFAAEIEALRTKRSDDLNEKNKALEAEQQRLEQSASVMSPEARLKLQQSIDAKSRELQFQTKQAQADVDDLKQELGRTFNAAIAPILAEVANTRHVQLLFDRERGGVVWVDPALDLTKEVIARLDADTAAGGKKQPEADRLLHRSRRPNAT